MQAESSATRMTPREGGRATASAPREADTPTQQVVCVWDLDETLIIFNSLMNGTFMRARPNSCLPEAAAAIGERWREAILGFCDAHMFFARPEVESANFVHVDDVADQLKQLEQQQQQLQEEVDIQQLPSQQQHLAPEQQQLPNNQADQPPLPQQQQQRQQQQQQQQQAQGTPAHKRLKTSASPEPPPPNSAAAAAATAAVQAARAASPSPTPAHPTAQHQSDPKACHRQLSPILVSSEYMQQLAHMFGRIGEVYAAGSAHLPISRADAQALHQLRHETDIVAGGWLRHADVLLGDVAALAKQRGVEVHHCVVTTGQLVATLGKLLLFGLDRHFQAADVYSAARTTKAACFKRIQAKHAHASRYLVIGDGPEEELGAQQLGWPFVRITLESQPLPSTSETKASAHDGATASNGYGTGPGATHKPPHSSAPAQQTVTASGRPEDTNSSLPSPQEAVHGRQPAASSSQPSGPPTDSSAGAGVNVAGARKAPGKVLRADALGVLGQPLVSLNAEALLTLALDGASAGGK